MANAISGRLSVSALLLSATIMGAAGFIELAVADHGQTSPYPQVDYVALDAVNEGGNTDQTLQAGEPPWDKCISTTPGSTVNIDVVVDKVPVIPDTDDPGLEGSLFGLTRIEVVLRYDNTKVTRGSAGWLSLLAANVPAGPGPGPGLAGGESQLSAGPPRVDGIFLVDSSDDLTLREDDIQGVGMRIPFVVKPDAGGMAQIDLLDSFGASSTRVIAGSKQEQVNLTINSVFGGPWDGDANDLQTVLIAIDQPCPVSTPPPTPGPFPIINIAFTSDRDGNDEIYVMNSDGTNQTDLSNNWASDVEPAWSPDGRKIAYASDWSGKVDVYVMNFDGTNKRRLTDHPAGDAEPVWSPDGTRIAFSSKRDGDWEVYVMNADGTGQTRLTDSPTNDYDPAWSPDGRRIAFASNREGNDEIYVMNPDGEGLMNLTNNPAADSGPAWSPDGSKIAFESDRQGGYDIFVMNADGAQQTYLAGLDGSDLEAAWSPIIGWIAFYNEATGDIYAVTQYGVGMTDIGSYPAYDRLPSWRPFLRPSGDVDCNGIVDVLDALGILRFRALLQPYAACLLAVGNVDCSTEIDALDALRILLFRARLPTGLPAGCPKIGT